LGGWYLIFRSLPELDECRYLILKIVEQSVRDYLSLEFSDAPIEQYYYDTAIDFIFDDDYVIDYGSEDKSLNDLLDILDLNIRWFREKISILKENKVREFDIKIMLDGD